MYCSARLVQGGNEAAASAQTVAVEGSIVVVFAIVIAGNNVGAYETIRR